MRGRPTNCQDELGLFTVCRKLITIWILIAQYYLFRDYLYDAFFRDTYTIENDFFPAILANNRIAFAIFVAMFVLGVVGVFSEWTAPANAYPYFLLAGNFFLMIHQQGFFVQLFVVTFWTAIPLLWLRQAEQGNRTAAAGVSSVMKLCISLVFFGAVLGKLTPGFLDGSVFAHLSFPGFTASTALRVFFSRAAIVGEGFVVLCYFVRNKYSFLLSGPIIFLMWMLTDYSIVNAMGPLLGLAIAGFLIQYPSFHRRIAQKWKFMVVCHLLPAAVLAGEPLMRQLFASVRILTQ